MVVMAHEETEFFSNMMIWPFGETGITTKTKTKFNSAIRMRVMCSVSEIPSDVSLKTTRKCTDVVKWRCG